MDLNPVPILITKALIELPSAFKDQAPINPESQRRLDGIWRGATGLAEDVRYYGGWIKAEAEQRLGYLYPKLKVTRELASDIPQLRRAEGQSLPVVVWFWARTVESSDPSCGKTHVPLVSSYWLSTKKGSQAWIESRVDRASNKYSFAVRYGEPSAQERKTIGTGTKIGRGCKFKCLLSDQPIPEQHVKQQGMEHRLGVRLMAVAVEGPKGRVYVSPSVVENDVPRNIPFPLPRLDTPIAEDKRAIWCTLYGLDTFTSLFTQRQLAALGTLSTLVREVRDRVYKDALQSLGSQKSAVAYADSVATYLAFAVTRAADYNSTLASWRPKDNAMRSSLAKQGLPVVWDFAEANPFAKSSAGYFDCVTVVARCLEFLHPSPPGVVSQLDAIHMDAGGLAPVISTDPPYYDNIGYADLSDFLYVWLRECLDSVYPSLFSTMVTPKVQELIASPYRHKGNRDASTRFFETGLEKVFQRAREIANADYPLTVFYAFKQSESSDADEDASGGVVTQAVASTGWETILSALVHAGFAVTGTWPMRTEGDNRQVGIGANALASSIVLVCRPRSAEASLATRRQFLSAMKQELPDALRLLQKGSIAPVDLAQAAIGPGMAVFTRYAKVMEADGSPMKVRQALALINQTLDEVLAEQEGEFDKDTRWALAWFEQFAMDEAAFGVAETLSKAKNTAVNGLEEAGIIHAKSGKVRLLKRQELSGDWDPAADNRVSAWEVTQYLIHALETGGETAAATLLRKLGGLGETARGAASSTRAGRRV